MRIAGAEVARHRLLIDVIQVAGGPALADHVDDRALAGLGDATALEQLDERAVGRGGIVPRPTPGRRSNSRGDEDDGNDSAPSAQHSPSS